MSRTRRDASPPPERSLVAIDPSLTNTGVAIGETAADVSVCSIPSRPGGNTVGQRVKRLVGIIATIERMLIDHAPAVILVEQYAYSRNQGGQMFLGELGGVLRWHLVEHTPHVLEVNPATLKKFATGKGNAPKELVMAHVAKRWGVLFSNSDEADAFVMFQMGLVMTGRQPAANSSEREAVKSVLTSNQTTAEELAEAMAALKG